MPDFERVRLVDVSRHYGRRRALSHVSFEARAGDIVGLLGPNGAGKSTFLGLVAALIAPSSGEVLYDERGSGGRRVDGVALRGRIGFLAHELHLYPELSARQNLTFFASLYGLSPADVVERGLAGAGLTERGDDEVAGFSRGMRQRLALERTLLHSPRLVLLDEPFTGLDDGAVTLVCERLRRLAANGVIVLISTHDLDVAERLLTRVALVQGGRLVADETAAPGLRERYRARIGSA